MSAPDIYEYLDFRSYLKDAFEAVKARKRFFTQRYIAKEVGMKSTGHVSWILQGKRNLSEKMIGPFTRILGLTKNESDFFEALVHFSQAGTHVDKKYYLDQLVAFQKREKKGVELHQYELFEKWYYPVVRELVAIYRIKDNFKYLASKVVPRITVRQAEQSVTLLERLGFISKDQQGYYVQTDPALTTGEALKKVAVRHFQMETFDLAKQALNKTHREERDISTLTMSISRKRFANIQKRIREFREEIIAAVKADDDQEQVYELNLALFPLSKSKEDDRE